MNLQCILCKHKNNEQACHNAIYSSSWTCPTLSNIYYGKLIDWFPFNIFHHIKTKIKFKEMEKFYNTFNQDATENDDFKFIFGIISADELTSDKPNLLTMNDFDVIYDKRKKKYFMSVETIYTFKNGIDGEREYLNEILDKFTKWMIDNNYSVEKNVFYEIFTHGDNITTDFDSIQNLYATFKCLVKGFDYEILNTIKKKGAD